MTSALIVTRFPVPKTNLGLGSLITSLSEPQQGAYTSLTPKEKDILPPESHAKFKGLVTHYRNGRLAAHLAVLNIDRNTYVDDDALVKASQGKRYLLKDPQDWFEQLCGDEGTKDKTRKWITTKCKNGGKIYLVTGYLTYENARVTMNAKQGAGFKTGGNVPAGDVVAAALTAGGSAAGTAVANIAAAVTKSASGSKDNTSGDSNNPDRGDGQVSSSSSNSYSKDNGSRSGPLDVGFDVKHRQGRAVQDTAYTATGEQIFALQLYRVLLSRRPFRAAEPRLDRKSDWFDVFSPGHRGEGQAEEVVEASLSEALSAGPKTVITAEGSDDVLWVLAADDDGDEEE